MTWQAAAAERWAAVRYGLLLSAAARRRELGRAFAKLVARFELARDPTRRRAATERLGRALGANRTDADRIFCASLESEAREEADSAYFMQHPGELMGCFERSSGVPSTPAILATLHFGSPVLGYLFLRRGLALDVSMVARPLDASNPMPAGKSAFARRKVAWTESFGAKPFLFTDAGSIARARAELLAGGLLYTPIDVPGDVTTRSAIVPLFGERVRLAAGVETLARLTGAPIRPIVTNVRGARFELWLGAAAEAREDSPLDAAIASLEGVIRSDPGEWWMWAYLSSLGAGEA